MYNGMNHFGTGNGLLRIFIICLAVAGLRAQAPTDTLRLSLSLPAQARYATADNLGFIYLVTQQNAIEKYTPDGRLLTRYTNNRLGAAAMLDVSNPLKILVWYGDFRTVVFLDRSLTLLGELNLISAGYPEVRAIATAQDGNLWLYDEIRFQLRKISPGGEVLFESQAMNQLFADRLQIVCLHDDGNEVLASDTTAGVLQFDIYAQFQRILPWKGVAAFLVEQNRLVFAGAGVLHFEHLQALSSLTLPLPATARAEGGRFWLAPQRVFVQNGEQLEMWAL